MLNMLSAAKAAKTEIARLTMQQKNDALLAMADALLAQKARYCTRLSDVAQPCANLHK